MRVLGSMGRKAKSAVLALSVLLVVLGGQTIRASNASERPASPRATSQRASVTVPEPQQALVVQAALSSNTRGWTHGSGAAPAAGQAIRPELVDAYTLAVALAPSDCHLSLSVLAAIGQVESGNLAGQRIDAQHRVVPGLLGPVLDGSEYAAIPDTDNGRWDGHRTWDRALGPLQLLPASWRVAGMDADGDGRRDPQNVYDAAGAAMVYLCDAGRDLGTRKGLEEAVLSYNHSRDYLRLVLAWKTVFDTADVIGLGSMPPLGAWAASTLPAPTPAKAAGPSTSGLRTVAPGGSSAPGTTATGARPPKATLTATAASDPATGPTAVSSASNPPAPTAKPGDQPEDEPKDEPGDKPRGDPGDRTGDKTGDKTGDRTGDKTGDKTGDEPDADPTCLPSDDATSTEDPSAAPTCCPTSESTQPTETLTTTPSGDPDARATELLDLCATESLTATPSAVPAP